MKRTSETSEVDPLIQSIGRKRELLGISQTRLAELVGVSRQTISMFESGRVSPGLYRIRQICDALGLDLTITWKRESG